MTQNEVGPPSARPSGALLVDAHVHLHDCFDREAFLDHALANFRRGAEWLGLSAGHSGCLLFTETAGQHRFAEFRALAGRPTGPWQFSETGEDCSLVARRGPECLVLVAGRQIASSDGLELLALGVDGSFPERLELAEAIALARECDALPVIPWGFGKWWFERGARVRRAIESARRGTIFLGDNGGRLGLGRRPALFPLAAALGIPVLPGSDPLPFPAQVVKPGSYGFVLHRRLDPGTPMAAIKAEVRAARQQPKTYGNLEGFGRFCRNQLAMQIAKHRRGSSSSR